MRRCTSVVFWGLMGKTWTSGGSYRYVRNRDGHRVFDYTDRINIVEVKKKYDESLIFLTHTADVISYWTDYYDFKVKHSSYSKGKGYLRFPKLYRANGTFDQMYYDRLDELFERQGTNLWYDNSDDEFLEVQIDGDDFFVIAIENS